MPRSWGCLCRGGGYRAAAFHLGVLNVLNEQGILSRVEILSTVSGGSIIGARYCLFEEQYNDFRDAMYALLSKHTLFSTRELLFSIRRRTDILKSRYNKRLYQKKKLRQLGRKKPYLMVNATNLGTGNTWVFTREHMGDITGAEDTQWDSRARSSEDYEVANAVAASSAFPGAFEPVKLNTPLIQGVDYVALADGGVVDNQGVTALLAQRCDFLVVSDASRPLEMDPSPPTGRFESIGKAIELPGVALRDAHLSEANRRGCALIQLSEPVPDVPEKLVRVVKRTATHLKRFTEDDLNTLIGHGRDVAKYVLAKQAD